MSVVNYFFLDGTPNQSKLLDNYITNFFVDNAKVQLSNPKKRKGEGSSLHVENCGLANTSQDFTQKLKRVKPCINVSH